MAHSIQYIPTYILLVTTYKKALTFLITPEFIIKKLTRSIYGDAKNKVKHMVWLTVRILAPKTIIQNDVFTLFY